MLPLTATMKLTQELNTSAMKVEGASSRDAWPFSAIGDFVSDAVGEVGDTVTMIVNAGLDVGTVTANAALVVGTQFVTSPPLSWDDLTGDIRSFVDTFNNTVIQGVQEAPLQNLPEPVHVPVRQTAVRLKGVTLEHAKKTAAAGRKLAGAMGNHLAPFWDRLQGPIDCLTNVPTLCEILIGLECDCGAGSYVELDPDGHPDWVDMRCTYTKTSKFTSGFGIQASANSDGETDSGGLPGTETEREAIQSIQDMVNQVQTSREGLGAMQKSSPSGSCEAGLSVAIDGVSKFTPDVRTKAFSNGHTIFNVSGTLLVSYETMVSGRGSCSYTLTKGLPKKPITKVICAGPFCIMISLQMVATLVGEGVLTGTIHMRNDAEFEVSAHGWVNEDGAFEAHVSNPDNFKHQANSIRMGASAAASLKLSVGPKLVVWPMPGIPLTFHPTLNAEARAQVHSIQYPPTKIHDEGGRRRRHAVDICGAAAVSVYSDFGIEGFGLPRVLRELLSDGFIKEQLKDAMQKGVDAWIQMTHGGCLVDGLDAELRMKVADPFWDLIPDFSLRFNVPSFQLLPPQMLFCEVVWSKPDNFDQLPCAEELGCQAVGQGPPKSDAVAVPAEQVEIPPRTTENAVTCHDPLQVGDRFIQIGKFRIAAIDDNYLSISHQEGLVSLVVSDKRAYVRSEFQDIPASDYGRVTDAGPIWDRQPGEAKEIEFGFKFIQIGKFRLGDYEGWHFSISHLVSKETSLLWKHDGGRWHDEEGYTGHNTLDRFLGAPSGISIGKKFVQIGNFRLAETDDSQRLPLQFMRYRDDGTWERRTLETFQRDGGHSLNNDDHDGRIHAINSRKVFGQGCKNIGELAHGECSESFASWGDRFIQLGNWRLAALDADHFSISHKDGQNAIYKSNGHFYWERVSDRAWRRPLGFPHGIVFGAKFIQIGQFRLAALDDDHLSISHQNGWTNRLFVGHNGQVIDRPGGGHDWNAWRHLAGGDESFRKGLSAGISGVGYGDRFLQIGPFRIGVGEYDDLLVTHKDPATGHPRTFQVYQNSGMVLGAQPHASHSGNGHVHLVHRHTQWHCGNIQSMFGSCPGITAGDGFIQLGDWRLAAIDSRQFSISHRDLVTPMSFTSDGHYHRHGDPTQGDHSWHREARYVAAGEMGEVILGDRYIQFGKYWRMGQVDDDHFSISHIGGRTPVIFYKDGNVRYVEDHSGFDDGPFSLWNRHSIEPKGIGFGDGFVQIGDFRVGDVDHERLSVANAISRKTSETFKKDGHTADSGSTAWTTLGRALQHCQVVPRKASNFTSPVAAFYNPKHGRWLQMNKGITDMTGSADQRGGDGPFSLRLHWTYERFAVVDVGNGEIALHNTLSNRFVKMEGLEMMVSSIKDVEDFPAGWNLERFRVVDAGDGMVALYHPVNHRFVTMDQNGHVYPSAPVEDARLPVHWSYERFYMMPVRNFLEPDTLVALYSNAHGRFLRMYQHASGHCDLDSSPSGPSLPDTWTLERFRVVDAGNGMVALHSHAYNKYLLMDDPHFDIRCSAPSPTGSSELPHGWGWEAFVPVPMAFHADHLEIALWHPAHHRAVRMNHHIVDASQPVALQDLAMNTALPWEKFRVVLLADPMT
ncbi:unnamed protein product [Symbiodinium sp. KB8]|nr:unnamed protein product [Symbiodinium sp. KB8]